MSDSEPPKSQQRPTASASPEEAGTTPSLDGNHVSGAPLDAQTQTAREAPAGEEIEGLDEHGAPWGDYPIDSLLIRQEHRTVHDGGAQDQPRNLHPESGPSSATFSGTCPNRAS